MKTLFTLVALNLLTASAFADDVRFYCSNTGSPLCNGQIVGSSCYPVRGGEGVCTQAPATAGDFCQCRPVAPPPTPPADPCEQRPLPRFCM